MRIAISTGKKGGHVPPFFMPDRMRQAVPNALAP